MLGFVPIKGKHSDLLRTQRKEEQMTSDKIGGWELTKKKEAATLDMRGSIIKESKDLDWKPHPANEKVG